MSTDVPLPEILILHSVRPAFSAAPVPLLQAPPTRPAPDVKAETLPDSNRGPLQIPFNKGPVSGQITITREPDEPARPLLLSPSNTQVFDQLKAPFEHVRDPGWRLTDSGGEQQQRDSRQPQEEPEHEESPT
ncbi:hypothetical protein NTD84_17375 [Pseudomonas sp. 14P_8.1_Bac3]|nr:hypothetical protein [Pseudomonas sp. 14P_8.1_Bac3]